MARNQRVGRKTDYRWGGNTFQAVGLTGTQQIATIIASGDRVTVFRCRGEVTANMDIAAVDDGAVLGLGLIVAKDQMVTAGQAAFPSPIADLDADWIWHSFLGLRALQTSNEGLAGGASGRIVIDSKAMRKVNPNESCVLVFDIIRTSGVPTVDVTGGIRILFGS